MSEALTPTTTAISSAFSPHLSLSSSSASNNPVGSSPAKVIESCFKCYKQLTELNQLKVYGVTGAKRISNVCVEET